MNYSTACEILGFTTPKSLAENAALAMTSLRSFTPATPLRFKVAARVLIDEAARVTRWSATYPAHHIAEALALMEAALKLDPDATIEDVTDVLNFEYDTTYNPSDVAVMLGDEQSADLLRSDGR